MMMKYRPRDLQHESLHLAREAGDLREKATASMHRAGLLERRAAALMKRAGRKPATPRC